MISVKPCPFCGGSGHAIEDKTIYFGPGTMSRGVPRIMATCTNVACGMSNTWYTLAFWNDRPELEIEKVSAQFAASLKTEREAKEEAQQTIRALVEAMDVLLGGPDDVPIGALAADKTIRENWKSWREKLL